MANVWASMGRGDEGSARDVSSRELFDEEMARKFAETGDGRYEKKNFGGHYRYPNAPGSGYDSGINLWDEIVELFGGK